MNIVVVSNLYPPIVTGGAELIASYLCAELARRGHRVTVVSTCGPEMEPFDPETRDGVRILRFFPKNLYWFRARALRARREGRMDRLRTMRWHLRDAWNRDTARRIGPILDAEKPDLVHTHVLDGFSASVWKQASLRRIPVLHTAHDYHLMCPRSIMLDRSLHVCTRPKLSCRAYRSWHMGTTRHVDLFASPSRFLLERHREAGLLARDTAVVRNGIPMQAGAGGAAANDPGRRRRFLLMSQLRREKGIGTALAAFAKLPVSCGAELLVCGQGPMEAEVRAAAQADPRIRFPGFVANEAKRAALAGAGHMLLPSLWFENAPVTILEAAANELSVIGSRIGAIPEFVREGRTGLLFPPGDAEAMAAAMLRAMDDDALRTGLAEEAGKLLADFSVPRMTDEYMGHYLRLTNRPNEAARPAA